MNTILEPRKTNLFLRLAILIFLLGLAPFAIVGLHKEGKDYAIFFFVGILILLVPELYINLFLRPVSAILEENQLVVKFYHGTLKYLSLGEMEGFSTTEEKINYRKKKGVLLYLKNGEHLAFTEINLKEVSPLTNYLTIKKIENHGSEKLRPWFSSKYKYNKD